MLCQICNAELEEGAVACQMCGSPAPQVVKGFKNAVYIQQTLRRILSENGADAISDVHRFISLLKDYLPEYDSERRLLVNALLSGAFKYMLDEIDPEISITRTRSRVISECYVTDRAAEFVIVCFSYMLGRIFDPSLLPSVTVDDSEGEQPIIAEKTEKKRPVAIDSMVFQNSNAAKSRLSGNVVVPDGVTKLAGFCFNGFGFMKNITLPDTLMAIGEYAFSECKRLKGVVLPESLKKIERGAFSQCSKLTVIKIPRGVLEVEDSTFEFCSSLETVELPDTCSSIGARAFSCCDKLRKLFIPESVKFIDAKAFEECPELTIRCYANSYVHKYCLKNEISCETVTKGAELTAKMIEEG